MNTIKVPHSSAYFPRLYNGLQWSSLENSAAVWKTAHLAFCSQRPTEAHCCFVRLSSTRQKQGGLRSLELKKKTKAEPAHAFFGCVDAILIEAL